MTSGIPPRVVVVATITSIPFTSLDIVNIITLLVTNQLIVTTVPAIPVTMSDIVDIITVPVTNIPRVRARL